MYFLFFFLTLIKNKKNKHNPSYARPLSVRLHLGRYGVLLFSLCFALVWCLNILLASYAVTYPAIKFHISYSFI